MLSKLIFSRLGQFILILASYVLALLLAGRVSAVFIAEKTSAWEYALTGTLDAMIVLTLYYLTSGFILRKSVTESKIPGGQLVKCTGAAILMLGVPIGLLFLSGFYTVSHFQSWHNVPFVFLALFVQGLSSEVLFRGIIFHHFSLWIGPLKAILVFSVIYAGLNMMLDGASIQVFITHGLFSSFLCLVYLRTKNLWVTGTFHGMWLFMSFLAGVLDEHWRVDAPWITKADGNILISGGQLGPEASLFSLLILLMVNVYFFKLYFGEKGILRQTAE